MGRNKYLSEISLGGFEEAIQVGLRKVTEMSDGAVAFKEKDIVAASQLEPTPDKPNYARGVAVPFRHRGRVAGNLVVIAFLPEDGTGDESLLDLGEDIGETKPYPRKPLSVPRSKSAWDTEVHIGLASRLRAASDKDIRPNVGHLDLVGHTEPGPDGKVDLVKIGTLGNRGDYFNRVLRGETTAPAYPSVSTTVGTRRSRINGEEIRFGDPHAVYNPYEIVVQVAAFMAITTAAVEDVPRHAKFAADLSAVPAVIR